MRVPYALYRCCINKSSKAVFMLTHNIMKIYEEVAVIQAGKSRVLFPMGSVEFFIDIILLAALWAWGRLSL
jgi:hypothetical protein